MPPLSAASPALVLLATGTPAGIAALQAAAAAPLASSLQLTLVQALPAEPGPLAHGTLAALQPGSLVPLPQDPGRTFTEGLHWAELLGARRQPCLLLIAADQLDSGTAAAGSALLQQWRVPLVGLVQWQGPWDRAARLADRLPWLGWLDQLETEPGALALAAARRQRQLSAELG